MTRKPPATGLVPDEAASTRTILSSDCVDPDVEQAIRADEREKCAKVAKHVSDKWAEWGGSFSNITVEVIGDEIAAAIRSGGGE